MSKNTNLSFLTDYITADITNGRIGINNASPTVAFDVSGATKISGVLTLTSTISNGTFAYTLPSATGTLALTSALSGTTNYVAKFTSSTGIGNSSIQEVSGNIGIGITPSASIGNLQIGGTANASLFTQQGTDTVRIGVRASGRSGIAIDSSDVTYTNRMWYIDNNGANGSLYIGRSGLDVLTLANTGAATFSSSVGVGVTPNSLVTIGKTLETGFAGSGIWGAGQNQTYLSSNYYYASGDKFAGTGYAQLIGLSGGGVYFQTSTASGTLGAAATLNTNMFISIGGNVGIGTTSPGGRLDVKGATATTSSLQLDNGGATYGNYIQSYGGGSYDRFSLIGNDILFFGSGPTERMRITSGGNLLVGTTTDSGSLITASSYSTSSKSKISENATTVAANTATTIFSKSGGNGGALVLVTGRTAANNWFFDTVVFNSYNSATALSTNNGGSPPSRSYSVSGESLQVTVATALDNIYCFGLTAKY